MIPSPGEHSPRRSGKARPFLPLFVVLALQSLFIRVALSQTNSAVTWRDLQVTNQPKVGFTLLAPEQTGLLFINHLNEWASAENRVLNNGSGVAAGDFDNDGLPDLFFCSLNNQNSLFKNLGNWRFTNVTESAGLKFAPAFYRAAVFADLNGDGALDLLVGTVGRGVLCFLNDGRGHFTDITPQAGTTSTYATESVALGTCSFRRIRRKGLSIEQFLARGIIPCPRIEHAQKV